MSEYEDMMDDNQSQEGDFLDGSQSGETVATQDDAQNRKRILALQRDEGQLALQTHSQVFNNMKQAFSHFLENSEELEKNLRELQETAQETGSKHQRLVLQLGNLMRMKQLHESLNDQPFFSIPAFEAAISEKWHSLQGKTKIAPPRVGFAGWMGRRHVTPRGLTSAMLNRMVAVEGVVNKCSAVHPKLVQSVYVGETKANPMEKSVHCRDHWDITNFDKTLKDAQAPPANDPTGEVSHKLEIGLCQYKNHQKFVIQETPESAPTGQMPRSVDVIAEEDLVDSVKCGDRVRLWGVFRISPPKIDGPTLAIFKPYLIANNVQKMSQEIHELSQKMLPADITSITDFAARTDAFDILSRSFAPSICGHEEVKKGLLLMLLGGAEREVGNHHIRGDIHMLLVGDPSCGKSQMLRYVMNVVPGTVSATGRGSTGVGLTAAVVTDPDTGERRIEGGAMVMGDRHIVCIDEFDKMQPADRVAIHEVMEQQTVTVAKAGIHTTLNARCSVLAAANPLYGCWSDDTDYRRQLTFQESLMSRFDLVYVIRDSCDEAGDERIADAVLHNVTRKAKAIDTNIRRNNLTNVIQPHMSGYAGAQKAVMLADETKVFAHRTEMIYNDRQGIEHEVLSVEFLRKFIGYAKAEHYTCMAENEGWLPYPELSEEAAEEIAEFYASIRARAASSQKPMLQSVTVRTLEGVVRLATAHARLKLSRYVTAENVAVAKQLLNYSLFGEAMFDGKATADEGDVDENDDDEDEDDLDDDDDQTNEIPRRRSQRQKEAHSSQTQKKKTDKNKTTEQLDDTTSRKRSRGRVSHIDDQDTTDNILQEDFSKLNIEEPTRRRRRRASQSEAAANESPERELNPRRMNILTQLVSEAFQTSGSDELTIDDLLAKVNKSARQPFSSDEFLLGLNALNDMDCAPILFDVENSVVYSC